MSSVRKVGLEKYYNSLCGCFVQLLTRSEIYAPEKGHMEQFQKGLTHLNLVRST